MGVIGDDPASTLANLADALRQRGMVVKLGARIMSVSGLVCVRSKSSLT